MEFDRITAFYRACNPNEVLHPGDPRYVNCDLGRKGGVAPLLARDFRFADPRKPLHRMFTGHLGVGKSTELQRLRKILDDEGKIDVIYFDVGDHLEGRIHDLQITDLDILFADQIIRYFKSKEISISNSFLREFADRFRQVLEADVVPKEFSIAPKIKTLGGLEIELGEIVSEIKSGPPSSRQILRKAISETRYTLRKGLNDLLSVASQKSGRNLLIIADGVEKTPSSRHEDLFINGVEQLVDINAHVLFTIPMQLAYHPRFSEMKMAFAHEPKSVPMIHPNTADGVECLREILATRADYAGIILADVFESDGLCDKLCRQSGGHVRQLLMFAQAALARCDSLPVTEKAVEGALTDYRIGIARQVPSNIWPWLRHFRQGRLNRMPDGIPDDVRRDVINQLLVFEYINGDSTYDVAPEIRNLAAFNEGDPA